MDTYFIGWIIVFIIICFLEIITNQLVAIWFAVASAVCVFLSFFRVDLYIQLIVFIVVSFAALLVLRPYVLGKKKLHVITTNAHDAIGKYAVVIVDFDDTTCEGRVQLEGMDWAAKTKHRQLLKKGDEVIVKSIEGVKLIVEREDK